MNEWYENLRSGFALTPISLLLSSPNLFVCLSLSSLKFYQSLIFYFLSADLSRGQGVAWHYCSSFVAMWKSCEFSMQEWRTFTLVCIFKFSWPWLRSLDTKISIRNESDWTCELLSILGPIFWMLSLTNHDEHEAPQLACPTFFPKNF